MMSSASRSAGAVSVLLAVAALAVFVGGCGSKGATPSSGVITAGGSTAKPFGIAYSPDGKYLYVADQSEALVRRYQVASGSLVGQYSVALFPMYVAVSSDGKKVFVSSRSNYISVIDVDTGSVTKIGVAGGEGRGVLYSSTLNSAFVADYTMSSGVTKLDLNAAYATKTLTMGSGEALMSNIGMELSPNQDKLYLLSNSYTTSKGSVPSILTVDPAAMTYSPTGATITLSDFGCKEPTWMKYDNSMKRFYVACGQNNSAIGGAGAIITVEKPDNAAPVLCGFDLFKDAQAAYQHIPDQIALDKDNKYIFTIIPSMRSVAQIDRQSLFVMNYYPTEQGPVGLAVSPVENKGYVSNVYTATVTPFTITDTYDLNFVPVNHPFIVAPDMVFTSLRRNTAPHVFVMKSTGACQLDVTPHNFSIAQDPFVYVFDGDSYIYFVGGNYNNDLGIYAVVVNKKNKLFTKHDLNYRFISLYNPTSGTVKTPVVFEDPKQTVTAGGQVIKIVRVIFVSTQTGKNQIFAMDGASNKTQWAAGGRVTNISNNSSNDSMPTACTTGTDSRIVFISDRGGKSEMYMAASDGTGVLTVTGGGTTEYLWPSCNPAGTKVAFVGATSANDSNTHAVYVGSLDFTTGALTGVVKVSGTGNATHPSWSSDENYIYFVSNRSGTSQVYKAEIANPTADPVRITNDTYENTDARWK